MNFNATLIGQMITFGLLVWFTMKYVWPPVIQAMQDRLAEVGYTLLLASSNYDADQELNQVRSLIERGLDGLMLIGEARPPELYELLIQKAIPYVNTWTFRPDSGHPSIGFDNQDASRRLASYLIDMGHSEIAIGCVSGF